MEPLKITLSQPKHKKKHARARPPLKDRFINYTPNHARGTKGFSSARSLQSEIYTEYLTLNTEQRSLINNLYVNKSSLDATFDANNTDSQLSAKSLLADHALDASSRQALDSRWSVKWADTWGKDEKETRRVLYQCDCGYDHTMNNVSRRRNAVDFTGCLAHAEVTYHTHSEKILRVRGYLDHNDGCRKAGLSRMPTIPLHPSVYHVALAQLKGGSTLTDIQEKNREMFKSREYPEMPEDLTNSPYRWLLQGTDTRSLYRQFNRMDGINTNVPDYINVDEWLDPKSAEYNKTLADAVFHYSARVTKGERLEVCIATEKMKEAAWRYAHKSQIILDGTFGVCDKKILLFIVMGVDERRRGVPLAFLMFSAPSQNRKTCAGYNTDILTKLLMEWKHSLGKRDGKIFEAYVAITDTDLMERGALILVFPKIWLLICRFHLRQSWRNHRNKVLKGKSALHTDLRDRLRRLEEGLVETINIVDAHDLIGKEWKVFEAIRDSEDVVAAEKGLEHLKYLRDYWTTDALWSSWSAFGRRMAAGILNCEIEGVLPTTNHLESFNGLLKRKHIHRWQHAGRRLRLDVLVKLLIIKVLPSIFNQREMEQAEDLRFGIMLQKLRGGDAILKKRGEERVVLEPVAYLLPDEVRDNGANKLISDRQISSPVFSEEHDRLTFQCYSALATAHDELPLQYTIVLAFSGMAECTCPDFKKHGGACKHIRAALLYLGDLRNSGIHVPAIPIPSTLAAARALQSRLLLQLMTPSTAPRNDATMTQQTAACIKDILKVNEEFHENIEREDREGSEEVDDDCRSVSSESSTEEDNFEFVRRGPRAALDEQSVARVFYELDKLPAELPVYLQNTRLRSSDLDRASAIRDHLTSVVDALSQMIAQVDPAIPREPQAVVQQSSRLESENTNPNASPKRKGKRKARVDILGASPEKASKRKNSYGVH